MATTGVRLEGLESDAGLTKPLDRSQWNAVAAAQAGDALDRAIGLQESTSPFNRPKQIFRGNTHSQPLTSSSCSRPQAPQGTTKLPRSASFECLSRRTNWVGMGNCATKPSHRSPTHRGFFRAPRHLTTKKAGVPSGGFAGHRAITIICRSKSLHISVSKGQAQCSAKATIKPQIAPKRAAHFFTSLIAHRPVDSIGSLMPPHSYWHLCDAPRMNEKTRHLDPLRALGVVVPGSELPGAQLCVFRQTEFERTASNSSSASWLLSFP